MTLEPDDMDALNGNPDGVWFRAALREPDGEPGICILIGDVLLSVIALREAVEVRDLLSYAIERAQVIAETCGDSVRRTAKAARN